MIRFLPMLISCRYLMLHADKCIVQECNIILIWAQTTHYHNTKVMSLIPRECMNWYGMYEIIYKCLNEHFECEIRKYFLDLVSSNLIGWLLAVRVHRVCVSCFTSMRLWARTNCSVDKTTVWFWAQLSNNVLFSFRYRTGCRGGYITGEEVAAGWKHGCTPSCTARTWQLQILYQGISVWNREAHCWGESQAAT